MMMSPVESFNIIFDMDITPKSMSVLTHALVDGNSSSCASIFLFISSSGGNVPAALAVATFIETISKPVYTVNFGHVDSAAIILYAAGIKRFCATQGSFLFHALSKETAHMMTIRQLRTELAILEKDTRTVCSFLAKRTGMEYTFWERQMDEEILFCFEDAIHSRLVTEADGSLLSGPAIHLSGDSY